MEELTNANLFLGLGGALIVAALIEAVKRMVGLCDTMWTRVLPPTAIVLGVAWNALIWSVAAEAPYRWSAIVLLGILTGLSAIGFYSGQKAVRGQ